MPLPTDLPTNHSNRDPSHTAAHNATNTRVNDIAVEVNAHETATDPHGDRAYTHLYDVRAYGLATSGLKVALAAATAAADAAGGGQVHIPAGVHLYDGWTEVEALALTATTNIAYAGDGPGTILRLNAGATGNPVMLPLVGSNLTARGLRFDTSGATSATCVRVYATSARIAITGCVFDTPKTGGIYLDSGAMQDIVVTGCHFNGAKYGILTRDDCAVTGLAVVGNTFRGGTGGDGIEINTPTARGTDITVTGNTIVGYSRTTANDGIGIGVAHASNITITGNTVRGTGGDGIHIEDCSHGVVVTGNAVADCARGGISVLTSLASSGGTDLISQINVSDNVILGCGATLGDAGLTLEGGTLAPASVDHVISGNIVYGCGRAGQANYAGIRVGYGTTRTLVTGNMISNTIGGVSSAGICVDAATDVFVTGNRATDSQATKTQNYGLRLNGSATRVTMVANSFAGNATAETTAGAGVLVDVLATPASSAHDLATAEANLSRVQATSASVTSAPSNTARLCAFVARTARTVSKIRVRTGSTAAGATPTVVQFALYQVASSGDLTLLAVTANDTTLLAATTTAYEKALPSSVTLVAGQRYAVGILIVTGAALPTFTGVAVLADTTALPYVASAYAASGSFPSSITLASTSGSGNVPYVAVVE